MKKMTQQNLRNIRSRFEEETGVNLKPKYRPRPVHKLLVLALISVFCGLMAAFSYPLFSPLNGDDLSLSSAYEGNGVFSIYVENRSDKTLRFQEKTKLMCWSDSEEVASLGGDVVFQNTEFLPQSEGIMIIDLSRAYDVNTLEKNENEQYYLVLTNLDFLFGHDWMCSVNFRASDEPQEEFTENGPLPSMPVEPLQAEEIEEELCFYFEDGYMGQSFASNEQNEIYMQKVQELLTEFHGTVLEPTEPMLILNRLPEGIIFDETVPADQNYALVGQQWHAVDGYNRLVGTGIGEFGMDHSLQLLALLPSYQGEVDGGVYLPLHYFFIYDVSMTEQENTYAFIYGRLLSFHEMEAYKVYQDQQYAVYEMTDLFYTDLDAYIGDFLMTNQRIYFDETIRQRVHNMYSYYKDPEILAASFHYHLPGLCPEIPEE